MSLQIFGDSQGSCHITRAHVLGERAFHRKT
jgi:hypothetical protein